MSDFNFFLVSAEAVHVPYSDEIYIKYSGYVSFSDSYYAEKHYVSFILKKSDTYYCIGQMYKLDLSGKLIAL